MVLGWSVIVVYNTENPTFVSCEVGENDANAYCIECNPHKQIKECQARKKGAYYEKLCPNADYNQRGIFFTPFFQKEHGQKDA